MINKDMDLFWINTCDLSLILTRISWDQNGYLYTGVVGVPSCSLDNYRFFTDYLTSYTQSKWLKYERSDDLLVFQFIHRRKKSGAWPLFNDMDLVLEMGNMCF